MSDVTLFLSWSPLGEIFVLALSVSFSEFSVSFSVSFSVRSSLSSGPVSVGASVSSGSSFG